jgi:hypothetical protein
MVPVNPIGTERHHPQRVFRFQFSLLFPGF